MSVATAVDLTALVEGTETDPHRVLGPHGDTVRAWRPDATEITLVLADGTQVPMEQEHPAGVFVAKGLDLPAEGVVDYRFEVAYAGRRHVAGRRPVPLLAHAGRRRPVPPG